jgi:2-polyprenyl-3-methyl-5-hydroxy-6-metoxy-1,4-benzoquinol methylase
MVYSLPRPSAQEIKDLYASETYSVDEYLRHSLVLERLSDFERIYARLENYLPDQGLLVEFGCAAGHFLNVGRQRGWEVQGIDASRNLVEYARHHLNLNVSVARSIRQAGIEPSSVDVIYSEHVLEHLVDPLGMLGEMREALREGGYLVITAPNELQEIRFLLRKSLFRRWAARKSSKRRLRIGHINFFSLETMLEMVQRAGFTPVYSSTWGVAARSPMVSRSAWPKRWIKQILFAAAACFNRGPNIEVFALR